MTTPTIQGKRLLNLFVDSVVVLIVFAIVYFVVLLFGYDLPDLVVTPLGSFKIDLWFVLVDVLYYILAETIWGKTIGKLITKTRVVMLDGSKPRLWDIILRTIGRFIPFDAVSFLFSSQPWGWHDQISKTIVVDEND